MSVGSTHPPVQMGVRPETTGRVGPGDMDREALHSCHPTGNPSHTTLSPPLWNPPRRLLHRHRRHGHSRSGRTNCDRSRPTGPRGSGKVSTPSRQPVCRRHPLCPLRPSRGACEPKDGPGFLSPTVDNACPSRHPNPDPPLLTAHEWNAFPDLPGAPNQPDVRLVGDGDVQLVHDDDVDNVNVLDDDLPVDEQGVTDHSPGSPARLSPR